MIIGFVFENGIDWSVEGDPDDKRFGTPREAAEYGYSSVWKKRL